MWSYEEMAGFFRMPSDDRRTVGVTAWDAGEMVGAGWAMLPLLDNTDKAECFVVVEPELRGRGIGAAVLEGLVAVARADGRTALMSNAGIPFEERADHPIMRWAGRNGFEVANVEIMRTLYLPVAGDLLDAVEAESAPRHEAYNIATYVDALPDELLPSYCHLNNQLVLDAPMGDLDYEEEALTPEVHKQRMARNKAVGRTVFTTLALLDGEVVAHTDLGVPEDGSEAHQWGTLVHRDHRGHRLGAAVKAANLRRMQQARPRRNPGAIPGESGRERRGCSRLHGCCTSSSACRSTSPTASSTCSSARRPSPTWRCSPRGTASRGGPWCSPTSPGRAPTR